MLNITGISELTNELTMYVSECHSILPTRTSFFISNAGKIESVHEFK